VVGLVAAAAVVEWTSFSALVYQGLPLTFKEYEEVMEVLRMVSIEYGMEKK
jgi:hypothetical protein